jgi:hypothetical protein
MKTVELGMSVRLIDTGEIGEITHIYPLEENSPGFYPYIAVYFKDREDCKYLHADVYAFESIEGEELQHPECYYDRETARIFKTKEDFDKYNSDYERN